MWNVHYMHFMIWYIDDVYSQSNSVGVNMKRRLSLKLKFTNNLIATCTVATESLCLHEATGASNHLSLDQSKQSVRIAQIGNIAQMGSVMPN